MTIGAINISSAAAGALPTTPTNTSAPKEAILTPGQTAAASQVAAAKANEKLEEDENRVLQQPPRAEAGFSSNQDEEHKAKGDSDEAEAEKLKGLIKRTRPGVDLTV